MKKSNPDAILVTKLKFKSKDNNIVGISIPTLEDFILSDSDKILDTHLEDLYQADKKGLKVNYHELYAAELQELIRQPNYIVKILLGDSMQTQNIKAMPASLIIKLAQKIHKLFPQRTSLQEITSDLFDKINANDAEALITYNEAIYQLSLAIGDKMITELNEVYLKALMRMFMQIDAVKQPELFEENLPHLPKVIEEHCGTTAEYYFNKELASRSYDSKEATETAQKVITNSFIELFLKNTSNNNHENKYEIKFPTYVRWDHYQKMPEHPALVNFLREYYNSGKVKISALENLSNEFPSLKNYFDKLIAAYRTAPYTYPFADFSTEAVTNNTNESVANTNEPFKKKKTKSFKEDFDGTVKLFTSRREKQYKRRGQESLFNMKDHSKASFEYIIDECAAYLLAATLGDLGPFDGNKDMGSFGYWGDRIGAMQRIFTDFLQPLGGVHIWNNAEKSACGQANLEWDIEFVQPLPPISTDGLKAKAEAQPENKVEPQFSNDKVLKTTKPSKGGAESYNSSSSSDEEDNLKKKIKKSKIIDQCVENHHVLVRTTYEVIHSSPEEASALEIKLRALSVAMEANKFVLERACNDDITGTIENQQQKVADQIINQSAIFSKPTSGERKSPNSSFISEKNPKTSRPQSPPIPIPGKNYEPTPSSKSEGSPPSKSSPTTITLSM